MCDRLREGLGTGNMRVPGVPVPWDFNVTLGIIKLLGIACRSCLHSLHIQKLDSYSPANRRGVKRKRKFEAGAGSLHTLHKIFLPLTGHSTDNKSSDASHRSIRGGRTHATPKLKHKHTLRISKVLLGVIRNLVSPQVKPSCDAKTNGAMEAATGHRSLVGSSVVV